MYENDVYQQFSWFIGYVNKLIYPSFTIRQQHNISV